MVSNSSRVSGWTSSSGTSSISAGVSITGSGSGSGTCGSKLGNDQMSNPPTSRARIRSLGASSLFDMGSALDHFFAALPAENDFSGFGHTAGNGEDFLLGGFHVADTHRALGFQVVTQQLGGTLGHVLEDLLFDVFVRPLEGQHQHVGRHFAQQRLDATVVDIGEVVRSEEHTSEL